MNKNLNNISRGLLVPASLLLVFAFLFPIWRITLEAPQYPEGLKLFIWVNKIQGGTDNDLGNLNILNHYIGMKLITPESIPELKIIPFFIIFFLIFALVIVFAKKRFLLFLWLFIFMVSGLIGLMDFYKWEYDYGHNLNPMAPIKIEGMAYQPPFLGSKQLLNITAHSWPDVGAYIATLSFFLGFSALILDFIKPKTERN